MEKVYKYRIVVKDKDNQSDASGFKSFVDAYEHLITMDQLFDGDFTKVSIIKYLAIFRMDKVMK